MRLLVCMMVCEKDREIASRTSRRLADFLGAHELHVSLFDDGSASHVGRALARELQPRIKGCVSVVRAEEPRGYFRLTENFMQLLSHAASSGQRYDYILRTDPDVHYCRRSLSRLFDERRLPRTGAVAPHFRSRRRDSLQLLADIVPFGFRRRREGASIDRRWQLAGFRRVWWSDLGVRALRNGYRGEITPGAFTLVAWETVAEWARRGYLGRDHSRTGLVFGDDVMIGIMVKALGRPLVHVKELVPDWASTLFLAEGTDLDELRKRAPYFVHPAKDTPWGHTVRDTLLLD